MSDRLLPPLVKRQAPYWSDWRAKLLTPETYPLLNDRQLRQLVEMQFRVRFGMSSAAMVRSGITGEPVHGSCHPHDWGDLERCEIAHAIAKAVNAEASRRYGTPNPSSVYVDEWRAAPGNPYAEATDCPICPMLATDRDDALGGRQ